MPPQVGVGGFRPRPMKASEASVRMALASQSVPITRISGKIFGKIWPQRIRVSEKPSVRQRFDESLALSWRWSAPRSDSGESRQGEVRAMAAMMFGMFGPSIATSISPRMSDGKRRGACPSPAS